MDSSFNNFATIVANHKVVIFWRFRKKSFQTWKYHLERRRKIQRSKQLRNSSTTLRM